MIYDLKRSIELRWLFDPVLYSSLADHVFFYFCMNECLATWRFYEKKTCVLNHCDVLRGGAAVESNCKGDQRGDTCAPSSFLTKVDLIEASECFSTLWGIRWGWERKDTEKTIDILNQASGDEILGAPPLVCHRLGGTGISKGKS